MKENQASITALGTAFSRAYHALYDSPKIFDDYRAIQLFSEEERKTFEKNMAESLKFFEPEKVDTFPDQASALAYVMRNRTAPITLSRSQYTENCLKKALDEGVEQYIILGAGFDTFAFREPEMVKKLQIFEIDHPATQKMMLERAQAAGLHQPEHLHFLPIDFTKENIADVLQKSAYNPKLLSFFSWLGVTYYLSKENIFSTLKAIVRITPSGSTIVFDYFDKDAFDPQKASKRMQGMQAFTKMIGEPMMAGFDPSTLAQELREVGLELKENLTPENIEERFFKGLTDGYHAYEHVHFARAIVL